MSDIRVDIEAVRRRYTKKPPLCADGLDEKPPGVAYCPSCGSMWSKSGNPGDPDVIALCDEVVTLRTRLAEVDGVFAASDAERCDLGCPHGDRCRLKAGHSGGHNMGACPCNEPMAPVLPGAVEVDPTEALERVLGVTRRSAGATGTVIDGPEGPLVRCTGLGRWWVVSDEGVEFGGADETFADACLACLRLIAAGKITHSGPGLDALTPEERAALSRLLGEVWTCLSCDADYAPIGDAPRCPKCHPSLTVAVPTHDDIDAHPRPVEMAERVLGLGMPDSLKGHVEALCDWLRRMPLDSGESGPVRVARAALHAYLVGRLTPPDGAPGWAAWEWTR